MTLADELIKEGKKTLEEMEKKADTNKDGKTSINEWFHFILKNPILLILAIVIISLNPIKDFITEGIEHGTWDWIAFVSAIGNSIIAYVFYLYVKSTDSEYRGVLKTIRDEFDKKVEEINKKCEDQLVKKNAVIEKLQKIIEDKDSIICAIKEENSQVKLALELKKQAYEIIHEEEKLHQMQRNVTEK